MDVLQRRWVLWERVALPLLFRVLFFVYKTTCCLEEKALSWIKCLLQTWPFLQKNQRTSQRKFPLYCEQLPKVLLTSSCSCGERRWTFLYHTHLRVNGEHSQQSYSLYAKLDTPRKPQHFCMKIIVIIVLYVGQTNVV